MEAEEGPSFVVESSITAISDHFSSDGDSSPRVPSLIRFQARHSHEEEEERHWTVPRTKRDELNSLVSAAWPQAIVVACRNLVDLIDTAVLGWLGTDELVAAAYAQIVLSITSAVLWQGFGETLITLTSQALGAGNPRLAGIWLQTSLVIICLASLPVAALWWFTGDLLSFARVSKDVQDLSSMFARYSLIWLLPEAMFIAFSQWLNGQQLVRPTIFINILFVGFNLGANIVLVHGAFGWGGLGFIGSPLATACTKICRALVMVWWVCGVRRLHEQTWHPWTFQCLKCSRISTLFSQALPAAISGFLEEAQFVVVTLMVGRLGKAEVSSIVSLSL